MRKGLFVGTFDPFTIGHDAIVRRALLLFDELVVGVGINEAKHPQTTAEERVDAGKLAVQVGLRTLIVEVKE